MLQHAAAAAAIKEAGGGQGGVGDLDLIAGANPQASWLGNILGWVQGGVGLAGGGMRHAPAGAFCSCKMRCLSC